MLVDSNEACAVLPDIMSHVSVYCVQGCPDVSARFDSLPPMVFRCYQHFRRFGQRDESAFKCDRIEWKSNYSTKINSNRCKPEAALIYFLANKYIVLKLVYKYIYTKRMKILQMNIELLIIYGEGVQEISMGKKVKLNLI